MDEGSLKIGDTVEMAHVDQGRSSVDPEKTVFEEIPQGNDEITLGSRSVQSRAYLLLFNVKGAEQQKKIGVLSGGERNRLSVAKSFMKGSNLLLLDEPTDDGDFWFIKSLEDALLDYCGCAVIISIVSFSLFPFTVKAASIILKFHVEHVFSLTFILIHLKSYDDDSMFQDRFFLDRVATHILAFESDSWVVWHEGNWQSYNEGKVRRLGNTTPKRTEFAKMPAL